MENRYEKALNAATGARKSGKRPAARAEAPRGGKSADPEFRQVTLYLRQSTYVEVRKLLLDEGRRDFSEFAEDAIRNALKSPKSKLSKE